MTPEPPPAMHSRQTRVMIVSSDRVYQNVAGPSIRALEMARCLAAYCEVVLVAPGRATTTISNVQALPLHADNHAQIYQAASQVDVIIVQGFTLHFYPGFKSAGKILVVDLYDPFHLESLES